MITCKEDLMNTYIENDFGELRDLYTKKAIDLGLSINVASIVTSSRFIFTKINPEKYGNVDHASRLDYLVSTYGPMKEVTLSDLKPKPTKFVKVEEAIFDLKGEFERGELYCKNLCASDDYTRLSTEVALFGCASADNIYRKVEIDWRDEVKKLDSHAIFYDDGDLYSVIDSNSNDFISMCHEVASLTEKPEGV